MAPRVSVGLIVYNGERYLESRIASMLGQSFRDIELIISDNGSTDGTERIGRAAAAGTPAYATCGATENGASPGTTTTRPPCAR